MSTLRDRMAAHLRAARRGVRGNAGMTCEALEDRQLLSHMTHPGFAGRHVLHGSRFAEFAAHGTTANGSATTSGSSSNSSPIGDPGIGPGLDMAGLGPGLGVMGIGGGPGPGLALSGSPDGTPPAGAPSFAGKFSGTAPGNMHWGHMSPPAMPRAVTSAMQTLQTDSQAASANLTKPSDASVQTLRTDLEAQHAGMLTGTDATTKIAADRDAVLLSTGLTAEQVANVDAAQGTLQADAQAIRDGTLTGTDATTKLQTDQQNVMLAYGFSQDTVNKLTADQQALKTAMDASRPTFSKTGGSGKTA